MALGLQAMYSKAGLDDMSMHVPAALVKAWESYACLERDLEKANQDMSVPVAKKNELLERFRARLGVMNSQNRAQQTLDQANERLEKWVQEQLPIYQKKRDEIAESLSIHLRVLDNLLEVEVLKHSQEALQQDPEVAALNGEMDALILGVDSVQVPCLNSCS